MPLILKKTQVPFTQFVKSRPLQAESVLPDRKLVVYIQYFSDTIDREERERRYREDADEGEAEDASEVEGAETGAEAEPSSRLYLISGGHAGNSASGHAYSAMAKSCPKLAMHWRSITS
jgi:hypothetical protein